MLTFLFISVSFLSFAQPAQNVRGKVVDSETFVEIVGAKIQIFTGDTTKFYRSLSQADGSFTIPNVPVGKHTLTVTYPTYDPQTIVIEVNSGKETIIDLRMVESFKMQEEMVVVARKEGEVINEMALISTRQFSVEETNRYPGSRMDPARMASNFAGVQGADDSRNDIVIRGNSPLGVVWKVEGVDIPNPSHFAIAGSTGGPVSILNNKILGNSDFFMSAFPAEYGNSISGIFDLKLRNGNNSRHEFTGQFGFLGTELMAEGPMSKNGNSSYLIMGRYSTLSLFQAMGVRIGTDAVPVYGDVAFKFNWKLKKGGMLSFFGIGGQSKIDILISEQKEFSTEFYGEGDRDQLFGTAMGFTGFNYKKSVNEKTYLTSTLSLGYERQLSQHNYLIRGLDTLNQGLANESYQIRIDSIYPMMGYRYQQTKVSYYLGLTHKFNPRHSLKAGINLDMFFLNHVDSVLPLVTDSVFLTRWDYKGNAMLIQPFLQWKWRITENMDFTAGLHSQYFSMSNSLSPVEPRIGWKVRMKKNQSLFAGAGMHSQMQPMYTYTYHLYDGAGNKVYHNQDMDFTRSIHTGIGYEKSFNKGINFRTEVYYQSLYNVPVTLVPSSYSLINMGSGFARFFPDTLTNSGTGTNYGLEITLQKYFSNTFFFLFSGTIYNSTYVGSDGIERNTSYNGNYVTNLLAGKEFKLNAKHTISLGTKITMAGGQRYGYVDIAQSKLLNEIIYTDSLFNERQFKDYFRLDLKVAWRMNAKKLTHEIGLDLVNILNTRNLLSLAYAPNLGDPSAEPIAEKQQLGFLPIFYYKVDFRFERKKEKTK